MATNLQIDDNLILKAVRLGDKNKKPLSQGTN